jgi:hypothetical protein
MRRWFMVALLCASTFAGCRTREAERMSVAPKAMSLSDLAKQIGVEFPPGSDLIGSEQDSGIDRAVQAKVAIPPSALATFLERLKLTGENFSEDDRYLLGENAGWWDPAGTYPLPTAQISLAPSRYLNVGLDRRDPRHVVLYLMWHEA